MEQPKDKKGRFLSNKQKIEIEITDHEFVAQVKAEIYALTFDQERIRKAYTIITGGSDSFPNVQVMKRKILAYNKN